jgi:outer membrane protein insertion porin family
MLRVALVALSLLPVRATPCARGALTACGAGAASAAPAAPAATAAQESAAQASDPQKQASLVRSIRASGQKRLGEAQLVRALGQPIGEPLDRSAIARGIDILWSTYRVRARVEERDVEGGVELLLTVQESELDLEPRFVGHATIDRQKILEWAGLTDTSVVYLDQAERIAARILAGYRREGFAFAEVRSIERPGGAIQDTGEVEAPDVIFEIREGPEVHVRDVVLHGASTYPESGWWFFRRGLRKMADAELHGPRLFSFFASAFDREELDADLVAMRQVYRDLGFLDAVVELDRLAFEDDREWVTLHVAVDEGPRYTVGTLHVVALERQDGGRELRQAELVIPEAELLPELALAPGEPLLARVIEADRRRLAKRFGKRGYLSHSSLPSADRWEFLEPSLALDPERPVVHVTYRIHQGHQQFIREVLLRGNLHTQDRVARRLITVEPGDVADPEEIERSRSRLQGSGYFSDSRFVLEHREPEYRFVETGDPNWKDLEFAVEEGQVLDFSVGGGVSSNFGVFGEINLSQRNFDATDPPASFWSLIEDVADRNAFHGAGQDLRLRASPGTRVSFYDLSFREPDVFGVHQDRIGLTLNGTKRLRAYSSHDEERREYGFELDRQLGPDGRIYAGFTLGAIEVSDLSQGGEPTLGDPETVPDKLREEEGKSDISYLEFGYRYATLDNRILPKNGQSLRFSNRLYLEGLASDYSFLRSEVAYDLYGEIGREIDETPDRWHLELGAGVAPPFGDTESTPYSESFFLGGQSRMRGFEFRGVGPNDHGFAIGGETFLFASLEYRRPLASTVQPGTYREIETVHWGAFVDAGVIDAQDFSIDLSEARVSAGLLFGLSVPLPITLSFGWPLRQGEGDDTQVLGFNIGF